MASRKKFRKGESGEKFAPVASANPIAFTIKPKRKPRGRSFEKGHGYGAEHRFKKGQSGNPSGRSRAEQIASAKISECLVSRLGEVGTKRLLKLAANKSYCQKLADEWIAAGLAGNVGAISSLADRIEGRPAVSVSMDGDDSPIAILIASMDQRSDEIGPAENSSRQLKGENEDDATGSSN